MTTWLNGNDLCAEAPQHDEEDVRSDEDVNDE